jgi:energy-coupling factor transporter ATP-binding protein EcfA2
MIPRRGPLETRERLISVQNLKFVYEGGVEALKGVNLGISAGEYVAIVGGNGSGKTTLAKNLSGLLRPTGGTVSVKGRPTSEMKVADLARTIGYAFQNPDHQLFCSSVEEEVRFGPTNLGYDEGEIRSKVERAIKSMGLGPISGRAPMTLRLGERRRVSIASVIAMDPEVLVLDEPTTGLDAEESRVLMEQLNEFNREGKTIILITHDMKLVAEHARRAVVMSSGRMLLDSDPSGAFSDLDLIRQSSLEPPAVTLLSHRLSEHGIPRDVISPEELVFHVMQLRGGA